MGSYHQRNIEESPVQIEEGMTSYGMGGKSCTHQQGHLDSIKDQIVEAQEDSNSSSED